MIFYTSELKLIQMIMENSCAIWRPVLSELCPL